MQTRISLYISLYKENYLVLCIYCTYICLQITYTYYIELVLSPSVVLL